MLCQTISSIKVANYDLASATICFDQLASLEGKAELTINVLGLSYTQEVDYVTQQPFNPSQGVTSASFTVIFGNVLSADVVATISNLLTDINNVLQALGYSGFYNVSTPQVNGNTVTFTVQGSSSPAIILVAAVLIILGILVVIGIYESGVVINNLTGTAPTPPNCQNSQQCQQQYQLYYEAYQQYLNTKSSTVGGISNTLQLAILAGLALLFVLAIKGGSSGNNSTT